MTKQVVTILAVNLNWIAYRNGHNEVVFVFTLDGAAFDITDYTFQVNFKKGRVIKLELKESDFLTNGGADGRLTIPLTKAQSAKLVGDRYDMEVVYTYDSKEYPLTLGKLIYHSDNNPTDTSTSVPVSVQLASGSTVNIAVTLAGQIALTDSGDL